MKAKFLALAALILGMVSCQNDFDGANVGKKGEVDFTLSVAVPEMETRAAGGDSAVGGLQNIDLENAFDIRYILEVYDAKGELAKERMYSFEDSASTTTFNLRLVPGRPYTFVVWADFVPEIQGERDLAADYDNHYETSEGLTAVQVIENKWTTIDESRDAYTGKHYEADFRSTSTINVTLTRPFAKLRVVTTDIKELYGELMPKTVKVNYLNTYFYNQFNALKQDVEGKPEAAGEKVVDLETMTYTGEDPKGNGKMTLFADYFFRATDDRVMFTMDVVDNTDQVIPTVVFNTNIPVQRNYLTTVMGPILTDSNNITVTIDDAFEGYHNIGGNVVTTNEELKAALTQNVENISVVLGADLTYDIAAWDKFKMGGDKTKTITISGVQPEPETLTRAAAAGAYTLTFNFTNSDWCNVVTDATLVLKDLNIKTSGYNTGAWNTAHLNFNCNVEMYNVTSTIVNFEKNAIVKNLKVNGVGGQYAIWVTAEGQTVSIDGLEVNAAMNDARGIKIGDQYVDSPAKVTLNIKNATFNTAKKAAILVSSKAGADINLEDVNIENVAADPVNAVWVDEDWAQYADLVTVTGGLKAIEGSLASNVVIVTTADELQKAINATPANATEETTIYLKKGTYQGSFNVGGNRRIILTTNEAVTIDGLVHGDSSNYITLRNLTLTNEHPGASSTTRKSADGYCVGGYANCFVIENCTFNLAAGRGKGGINIYAAFNACQNEYELTVTNCVFNCNGETPIRCKSNSIVDGCTFNDQRRYSMQFQANYQAASEKVVFTNNKVVNPCVTSGEPFAAGVQISHSQLCEDVALTIANNELTSTKFNDLKFAYDHEEASSSFGNIKITTCTLNGQPITEAMIFEINEDTNEVSTTMTKPEVDENEVIIKTAKELFWFANEVNVNNNSFSGKTVKLDADIDLENAEWTPVGQTGATQFKGTFDGQNHTISNLNIDKTSETGKHYSSGLFGWLNAATVKNVKVNGATVKGNHNVAVIAGYLETAGCTVENCHVSNVAVECHHANEDACGDKAGGVVGHAGNTGVIVKDCTAKISTIKAGRDAGQIVGAALEANVTGCSAENVEVSALDGCNDSNAGGNIRNEVVGRVL